MKGWHREPTRHSLAARGISTSRTSDIIRHHMEDRIGYGSFTQSAFDRLRFKDREMTMNEYKAFRYLLEEMYKRKKIPKKDMLDIDHAYGDILGAPVSTDWDIQITDTGSLEGTSFEIYQGDKWISSGKLVLMIGSDVIDWENDDTYENRDEVLSRVTATDLEFDRFDKDVDMNKFLSNAMPFIMKLAREEGGDLEISEPLDEKGINILKQMGFKTKYTTVSDIGAMTRMIWRNPSGGQFQIYGING